MDDATMLNQNDTYFANPQPAIKPRTIDIIITIFGCVLGVVFLSCLCWIISNRVYACENLVLLVAIPWIIYNYFFGRSLTRIMQVKSENYIQKSYLVLAIIQAATLIVGGIIGFLVFIMPNTTIMTYWRTEAILIPLIYFVVAYSSAYFAIKHYKPQTLQVEGAVGAKILPRSAYTKPEIITLILSLAFALFMMIYPRFWAVFELLPRVIVQILFIPWWFCSYDAGLSIAKWCYRYIAEGRQIIAYLGACALHVVPIIIIAVLAINASTLGISSDIAASQAAIDACNCAGMITVADVILIASIVITIGCIPAYVGVARYCHWVKKYQIQKSE